MIPKILHCFWAQGPKTKLAERCLDSWRKYAPDWELREWDVASVERALAGSPRSARFLRAAIAAKRWAAVSDWVRMWALDSFGGVYFDCDVELVRGIDDLTDGPWVAGERKASGDVIPNPGAGIALERGSAVARDMLDLYERQGFDPAAEMMAVIVSNLRTVAPDLKVLPPETFSPIGADGKMRRTEATRGIHWYAMSGASLRRRVARWLTWHGLGGVADFAVRIGKGFHERKDNGK